MVLDELDLTEVAEEKHEGNIKAIISILFWTWYASNLDRKVLTIKKWFISKTVYVRDLEGVFELLFGRPYENNL